MGLFKVYNRDMLALFNQRKLTLHMFVHIMHASLTGSQILMIVNSDTDVVVQDIAGMLI